MSRSAHAARALGLGLLLAAAPAAAAAPPELRQTASPAHHSACDRSLGGPLGYGWPVRLFRRQHPIRGNFGDPRTLAEVGGLGSDTPLTPGSFTFHNGVDITADTGTRVYPVVSGTARIGYADEVIVVTDDDRVFQYFHIRPAIAAGRHVVAYRTVLGRVLPRWLHVHLSEIDGFRIHNPADPGHLEPYRDHTIPHVNQIEFAGAAGGTLEPDRLHGLIRIAAEATDTPPLPVPGEWFGFPVTPALVAWRLTTSAGRVILPWRVVADFRHTEPPNTDFWTVYAADDIVLAPLSTTQELLTGVTSGLQQIVIEAKSSGQVNAAVDEANAILTPTHSSGGSATFRVLNQAALLATSNATNRIFTVLLAAVAAISLLVGGIGVMNIESCLQGVREPGACGARPERRRAAERPAPDSGPARGVHEVPDVHEPARRRLQARLAAEPELGGLQGGGEGMRLAPARFPAAIAVGAVAAGVAPARSDRSPSRGGGLRSIGSQTRARCAARRSKKPE